VGSDRGAAEAAIAAAKQVGKTGTALNAIRAANGISITIGAGSGNARVMLVGYDAEHSTAAGRGENNGRTLKESNVVRSIQLVGQWTGAPLAINASVPTKEKAAVLLEAPDGSVTGAVRVATSS